MVSLQAYGGIHLLKDNERVTDWNNKRYFMTVDVLNNSWLCWKHSWTPLRM